MSQVIQQENKPASLFSTCYIPFERTNEAPIILIHGLFASIRTFNPVKGKLGDKTRRTVFSYDLRNHGKSEFCDTNILDIDYDVADLKNFMDTKKIFKAVLVAHSIGARIAMKFALQYQHMVEKLVVEDMCITESKFVRENFQKTAAALKKASILFRAIPATYTHDEVQKKLTSFFRELIPALPDQNSRTNFNLTLPIYKDFKANKYVWDFNLSMFDEIAKRSVIYPLDIQEDQVYHGDVLFVIGEQSNFSLDHDKELIGKLFPNYEYKVFENGYHAFHQENPEKYLKMIGDFINQ